MIDIYITLVKLYFREVAGQESEANHDYMQVTKT